MRHRGRKIVAGALVFVAAASLLYLLLVPDPLEPLPWSPGSRTKTRPKDQPPQTPLANEYIRWYEFQFISRMRRVGSFSTDVQDLVNEIGLHRTLDRYVALREINLEYALKHPDQRTIPDADLERLALRQFEHILSSARSSRRWIDYSSPKLKEAGIEPLKQMSLAWIPFYQKLLSAPPSPGASLQERMKAHVSRDEYVQTIDRVTRAKAAWHGAVKKGIVWYASWVSWAHTMSDNVSKQDIANSWATVEDIYGDPNGANRAVAASGAAPEARTHGPSTTASAHAPPSVGPPPRPDRMLPLPTHRAP